MNNFFPGKNFQINSLNDLSTLDLSGFESDDAELALEFSKFKDAFISHNSIYASLIGHDKLVTSDENQIIQHVSQYEKFDTIPEEKNKRPVCTPEDSART